MLIQAFYHSASILPKTQAYLSLLSYIAEVFSLILFLSVLALNKFKNGWFSRNSSSKIARFEPPCLEPTLLTAGPQPRQVAGFSIASSFFFYGSASVVCSTANKENYSFFAKGNQTASKRAKYQLISICLKLHLRVAINITSESYFACQRHCN